MMEKIRCTNKYVYIIICYQTLLQLLQFNDFVGCCIFLSKVGRGQDSGAPMLVIVFTRGGKFMSAVIKVSQK